MHDEDLIHGLLSVVFWGFASGTDGRVNSMRALARSRAILSGRKNTFPQNPEQIVEHLRKARGLLEASRIADALRKTQKIKFLGMSFASKVLAFMNPSIAVVYDNVISNKLRGSDLSSLFVSTKLTNSQKGRMHQAMIYERWCRWCVETAETLNASAMNWIDWNGAEHNWRAVDVERAFFALG